MNWRGLDLTDLALWLCAAGLGAGALLLIVSAVIDCRRLQRAQRRARNAELERLAEGLSAEKKGGAR